MQIFITFITALIEERAAVENILQFFDYCGQLKVRLQLVKIQTFVSSVIAVWCSNFSVARHLHC